MIQMTVHPKTIMKNNKKTPEILSNVKKIKTTIILGEIIDYPNHPLRKMNNSSFGENTTKRIIAQ